MDGSVSLFKENKKRKINAKQLCNFLKGEIKLLLGFDQREMTVIGLKTPALVYYDFYYSIFE